MTRTCSEPASTITARLAPRERASRPMQPLPLKRSRKSAPSTSNCQMLKSDSRMMSVTGRVSSPLGAEISLPRALPAMMRIRLL